MKQILKWLFGISGTVRDMSGWIELGEDFGSFKVLPPDWEVRRSRLKRMGRNLWGRSKSPKTSILSNVRRMAEDGHQPSIDWLEHQEYKDQLRGLAEFIKRSAIT
jgi:hypothetical protein